MVVEATGSVVVGAAVEGVVEVGVAEVEVVVGSVVAEHAAPAKARNTASPTSHFMAGSLPAAPVLSRGEHGPVGTLLLTIKGVTWAAGRAGRLSA